VPATEDPLRRFLERHGLAAARACAADLGDHRPHPRLVGTLQGPGRDEPWRRRGMASSPGAGRRRGPSCLGLRSPSPAPQRALTSASISIPTMPLQPAAEPVGVSLTPLTGPVLGGAALSSSTTSVDANLDGGVCFGAREVETDLPPLTGHPIPEGTVP